MNSAVASRTADAGTKDAAVDVGTDTAPGCGTPSATNVFVAEGATAGPIGTAACTVNVAPDSYTESDIVVLANVTVIGSSGSASTFLTGTSTANCAASPCAVTVNRGGTLNRFAISASSSGASDGVVGEATASDGLQPPSILNVIASNMKDGNGIVALGAMNIGPSVSADGNAGQGLWVSGAGPHAITGLTATGNRSTGVAEYAVAGGGNPVVANGCTVGQ